MKTILNAAIVRDMEFDSPEELENYLDQLDHQKQEYKVVMKHERRDRTVFARIFTKYNNKPLLAFYTT